MSIASAGSYAFAVQLGTGHNVSSVKQAELSQAQSGAVIFGFRRSSAVLEVATLRLSHAVEQLSKMLSF